MRFQRGKGRSGSKEIPAGSKLSGGFLFALRALLPNERFSGARLEAWRYRLNTGAQKRRRTDMEKGRLEGSPFDLRSSRRAGLFLILGARSPGRLAALPTGLGGKFAILGEGPLLGRYAAAALASDLALAPRVHRRETTFRG